jgi:hypothetical protein
MWRAEKLYVSVRLASANQIIGAEHSPRSLRRFCRQLQEPNPAHVLHVLFSLTGSIPPSSFITLSVDINSNMSVFPLIFNSVIIAKLTLSQKISHGTGIPSPRFWPQHHNLDIFNYIKMNKNKLFFIRSFYYSLNKLISIKR